MGKKRLLDEIASLPKPKRRVWFDLLSPERQQELLEVREKWQDGQLDVYVSQIHALVKKTYGLKITECTFRRWISGRA